jgi:predicted transcriptional regulator
MIVPIERSMADADRLEQVAEIVSAYVSNNALSAADLSKLIAETHNALRSLPAEEVQPVVEDLNPAVPIKKSVTPDFIICLDDGKKFKSLKRHLSVLGMTPDEYRAKWGLPSNYPMVAPNYSAARSSLAKSAGLGRKPAAKPLVSTKRTRKPKINA